MNTNIAITIQSIGFVADVKLEDFIRLKLEKLEKFNEGIIGMEVFLRLEKSDTLDNKVVEVNVSISGNDFFARKSSRTFEESTDMVADALRRQLVRYKEKLRSK